MLHNESPHENYTTHTNYCNYLYSPIIQHDTCMLTWRWTEMVASCIHPHLSCLPHSWNQREFDTSHIFTGSQIRQMCTIFLDTNYSITVFIKAILTFSFLITTWGFCTNRISLARIVFKMWSNYIYIKLWLKGLRPVAEGFVVTIHEGACETVSSIQRPIGRGIWRTVCTSLSELWQQIQTDWC